jgi:hypothetical protein
MRCRGVSVMSREGQFDSQKPHSMQRLTRSDATGEGLRNFLCVSGSRLRMTPGGGGVVGWLWWPGAGERAREIEERTARGRGGGGQCCRKPWRRRPASSPGPRPQPRRRSQPGAARTRVEHEVGVEQRLELPHELVRLGAPLHLHKRRDVAARAVLALEAAAVLVGDDVAHLLHKVAEALDLLLGAEALGVGLLRGAGEGLVSGRAHGWGRMSGAGAGGQGEAAGRAMRGRRAGRPARAGAAHLAEHQVQVALERVAEARRVVVAVALRGGGGRRKGEGRGGAVRRGPASLGALHSSAEPQPATEIP